MSNVTSIGEARKTRSWNRLRWDWVRDVTEDPELSVGAKLLANTLVVRFAHHESGECNPGVKALADAMGTSDDSVKRHLRALEEGGWITRNGVGGRGRSSTISFHFLTSGKGCKSAPVSSEKGGNSATVSERKRGADLRLKGCKSAFPPTPPYKAKPILNQRGEPQRPAQRHVEKVAVGSWQAEAWDAWLEHHGFPPLTEIGRWHDPAEKRAWGMPRRTPPSADDAPGTAVAIRFAEWLRSPKPET